MIPLASSALTRRRQAEGDSETVSARSMLAMRPSRCKVARMARSVRSPGAGATVFAAAGLGRRAAAMTRWWFLVGVVSGAPIVCLIGASYVTALTGGGPLARG